MVSSYRINTRSGLNDADCCKVPPQFGSTLGQERSRNSESMSQRQRAIGCQQTGHSVHQMLVIWNVWEACTERTLCPCLCMVSQWAVLTHSISVPTHSERAALEK